MRLIAGHSSCTDLLHAHHQFHDVQLIDDLCHPRRRNAGDHIQYFFSGHVDIHDHPGDIHRRDLHGFFRALDIDGIIRNERIKEIKILSLLAIQLYDPSVLHSHGRLRIIRALHGNESHFRPFIDEAVLAYRTLVQNLKSFRSLHYCFSTEGFVSPFLSPAANAAI